MRNRGKKTKTIRKADINFGWLFDESVFKNYAMKFLVSLSSGLNVFQVNLLLSSLHTSSSALFSRLFSVRLLAFMTDGKWFGMSPIRLNKLKNDWIESPFFRDGFRKFPERWKMEYKKVVTSEAQYSERFTFIFSNKKHFFEHKKIDQINLYTSYLNNF